MDLDEVDVEFVGDLPGARHPSEPLRERLHRRADAELNLLGAPWHPHGPGVVAEVPADLAHDGRHRERQERRAAADVEPVGGLHQAEARDLQQVVEDLTASGELARDVLGQRKTPPDQLLAEGCAARVVGAEGGDLLEERLDVVVAVARRFRFTRHRRPLAPR